MNKHLIAFAAIVLIILSSAFIQHSDTDLSNEEKVRPPGTVYFRYKGLGAHNNKNNYTNELFPPGDCWGSNLLCWISFFDNDGIVNAAEWNVAFEAIDQFSDGANSLDDDAEGIVVVGPNTYRLEKKD